jgi:hypothetical protein
VTKNNKNKSNKYVLFQNAIYARTEPEVPVISSQMQSNPNPGQILMSYSRGFDGSSPKFALNDVFHIVAAGKRRSTVGLIGIFRPAY